MENYYERPVKSGEVIDGKKFRPWLKCVKCQTKQGEDPTTHPDAIYHPEESFVYRLSRAQAKAQGYAGNVLVSTMSSLCRACRPRRKLSQLTERELRTKVEFGELHDASVEAMVKKRKAKALAKQTRAAKERWVAVSRKEWMVHIQAVSEEIRAVTYQHKYAKKCGKPERLAFFALYLDELNKLRDVLRGERRLAEGSPMETNWREYVSRDARERVSEAWTAMPLSERVMLRIPELLNRAEQESNRQRLRIKRGMDRETIERIEAMERNRKSGRVAANAPVLRSGK